MAGILRWSNSIFKSVLPILVTWYRKTGELWKTANSLAAWGFGVSVDTGVKTTPERVKPITVSLQVVGNQQDNSGQQMQRTITGYRKSDGVAVVLYDYTTGLGPTINSTVTVTLDGAVEYNRFVGYIGGKLASGTTITIKITEWDETTPGIIATGGTITDVGNYRIHTFTAGGSFVVSGLPSDVNYKSLEYLVIAGGGGGGQGSGGGGGAGGYRSSVVGEMSGGGANAESPLVAILKTYAVTIGAGGAGANGNNLGGRNGNNSVFDTITSIGGGGGYGWGNGAVVGTGGSGGGGGYAGTANQGYPGGGGTGYGEPGSGGGAAGPGGIGYPPSAGGLGRASSITGSPITRATGGVPRAESQINGAANTGNGGAGRQTGTAVAGSGGSGIVIVRYKIK